MYDAAIIGAGPAGLSAALNFKLHKKDFIWFGSPALSKKVGVSEKIANYPGVSMVEGAELNARFLSQAQEMGIEMTDRVVTTITAFDGHYMLLADNEVYEAKTVILATGAVTAKGLPGEERLLGHGVSYCATCDGFLYPGKRIAVLCADKRYEHEVEYLAGIAKEVTLFGTYRDCGVDLPNVGRPKSPLAEIVGETQVEGVVLKDGTRLDMDGVFVLRSAVAPAMLLNGLEMDGVHIAVNRRLETNLAGCFAAGDCTGRPYQIAKAVGEGNVAAHSALEYLAARSATSENPVCAQA